MGTALEMASHFPSSFPLFIQVEFSVFLFVLALFLRSLVRLIVSNDSTIPFIRSICRSRLLVTRLLLFPRWTMIEMAIATEPTLRQLMKASRMRDQVASQSGNQSACPLKTASNSSGISSIPSTPEKYSQFYPTTHIPGERRPRPQKEQCKAKEQLGLTMKPAQSVNEMCKESSRNVGASTRSTEIHISI